MTATDTPIRPRRLPVLRIEIAALAMLLAALAIVLFTNAPPVQHNGVAPTAEPVRILPVVNSSVAVPRAAYPMQPAAVSGTGQFSKTD